MSTRPMTNDELLQIAREHMLKHDLDPTNNDEVQRIANMVSDGLIAQGLIIRDSEGTLWPVRSNSVNS